ncbi:MAG: hypothetical protein J6Y20_11440 [Lachnospiraceae bacterium]|nr:hypothetical protein [Lachnospiraceae bacterium]
MGFRKESYATVWEVEPVSDTMTKGRISISRKNKNTGEYETDFSGFVSFVGTASAKKASLLKEKDRIRLGDVDVTNRYDKKNGVTYTNFKVFSFENQNENDSSDAVQKAIKVVDDGEVEERLPF